MAKFLCSLRHILVDQLISKLSGRCVYAQRCIGVYQNSDQMPAGCITIHRCESEVTCIALAARGPCGTLVVRRGVVARVCCGCVLTPVMCMMLMQDNPMLPNSLLLHVALCQSGMHVVSISVVSTLNGAVWCLCCSLACRRSLAD